MDVAPLFKPFRALGYITDNVPFAVNRKGKETYVTVSVGKAWQVYNCTKLTLSLVGPQLSGDIRALACTSDLTFAAVGNDLVECKRLHRSGVYRGGHVGPVRQLMTLGGLLLSLGGGSERDGRLVVWEIGKYDEPKRVIEFPPGFRPSCMAHPDTYLNKVLVGSEGEGRMGLWNFKTGTLLYTFKGWGVPIRTLSPSPALDVVGVGLADGRAVLHNVLYDEEVASFANAAGTGLASEQLLGGGAGTAAARGGVGGGACTALSFRSGAGLPLMAAGGGGGVVTVWNLEEKRLHTVIRDAHDAQLLSLHFFPGEPLLMSSAADNSVKHWVFDSADAMPRMLRFRAGHAAPPTIVRHYGQGGLRLLSAGCDRSFRVFSVHQDQQSRELSQGHTARRAKRLKVRQEELKLERVLDMDAREIRERDWANVLTAHEGDPAAYTWRLAHFSRGDHVLEPPEEELSGSPAAPVTSVALSHCGNFGFVGSSSGRIDRYNMQSGQHRGAYYRPNTAAAAAAGKGQASAAPSSRGGGGRGAASGPAAAAAPLPGHSGAVVGCAADGANRLLVSVGLDGSMRVWDFRSRALRAEVALGGPAGRLALHPVSGLAAVPRLVRRFRGHSDRVTGLHLSADSRWLLSSSMDGTMRVWDIPAAQCLQVLKLGSPVTSLSLSPSLDLLATTHVNRRGIYLWSNQALFGPSAAIPHSDAPVPVIRTALPTISDGRRAGSREDGEKVEGAVEGDLEDEDGGSSEHEEMEEAEEEEARRRAAAAADGAAAAAAAAPKPYELRDAVSGAPLPLAPELVTLSLLPRSHWDSLTRIEVIKARNKPIQPPKKPEAAPFFLPSVPGLSANPVFDPTAAASADAEADPSGEREAMELEAAGEEEDGGAEAGPGSRVMGLRKERAAAAAAGAAGPVSPFLRQLRLAAAAAAAAAAAGEAGGKGDGSSGGRVVECYGSLISMLRGMTPSAIDRELRAMQVLEGSLQEEAEVADLAALMDMLVASLEARRDFELCQALLSVVLAQHGDVISARPQLAVRAETLRGLVAATWRRLDGLLQHVRCMVGFFGNLQ
ncbi:hypothetical protein PLESTM_000455900 [Pleodorina starrii]|nr:hypothetical protein PLESTM_000455900 [Pleodorina starrii]